jgi:hypothetical protein
MYSARCQMWFRVHKIATAHSDYLHSILTGFSQRVSTHSGSAKSASTLQPIPAIQPYDPHLARRAHPAVSHVFLSLHSLRQSFFSDSVRYTGSTEQLSAGGGGGGHSTNPAIGSSHRPGSALQPCPST